MPRLGLLGIILALVTGCDDGVVVDPFAPQPDTSAGLTNVSADLDAVLEHGALEGACDRWLAGASDRRSKLLCGKSMFFSEHFGTVGLPAGLATFMVNELADEVGHGYEKLGMIADPYSADHLPLGLAPANPLGGTVPSLAYTCAGCHFARLPDGRYAVGAPNHAFEYGTQVLGVALAPLIGLGASAPDDHDPQAVARVQPIIDRLKGSAELRDKLFRIVAPLARLGMMAAFTREGERYYATWPPGTMDFVIEPLPLDDKVHTISKIIGLWGIPTSEEAKSAGMPHALLAWTGGARSLNGFVRGFVALGVGQNGGWSDARLSPLVEYIESLRAPANPSPPDPALAARGKRLFGDKGCLGCHDGPRGSGKKLYTYEEIGTDPAMKNWLAAALNGGKPCCGFIDDPAQPLTLGLKSPRLSGLWANARLLHNGSLGSLAELFCLDGPRPGVSELAYGDAGHDYTCKSLSRDEKQALIAFLLAN